ncbi:MAG TPA: hypothetical protein VEH04_06975, partial [Verrucomicrobiae bacterium]|nr:hypothetical protein [Verrucomicrobiae bacterium]
TESLPQIFAKELGELLTIAARDVQLEIICPRGVKPLGFIGRTETFENQRSVVKLSHLTSGQTRTLFLRCRVVEETPEIAQVNVAYADEIEGGSQNSQATLRVRFTEDREVASRSVNKAVIAEKELFYTGVLKDEALADADAGNLAAAASKLKKQSIILQNNVQYAPAPAQAAMERELKNLEDRSQQLESGRYDAPTRKALSSESFSTRNSK